MSFDPVIIGCCGANLASLDFAFSRLGYEVPVSSDPERVRAATHVVLPGVGAARDAMTRLDAAGLVPVLPTLTQPVLGICLGMQLLFARSDEEAAECLGIIDAPISRLPETEGLPIPEMGWNQVVIEAPTELLDGVRSGGYAYFVHSYAAAPGPYTRATTDYGGRFSSVVARDNFFGTQFHPERSSELGARILDNFMRLR
jgi:glutamine amidotransferase